MPAPRRALLSVCAALAGCGDDLAPPPGLVRDGAELAIPRWVFPDGARAPARGWFVDRVLDAACVPTRWSDGATYCTPPGAGETVFVESTCTVALGQVPRAPDGSAPPPPAFFVRRYQLGEERRPAALYRPLGEVPAPPEVWVRTAGICGGPIGPGVDATYYGLEELAAARVRTTPTPITDALALDVLTTDDGLRTPGAWRDRALDAPCRITADGDAAEGDARCEPVDAPAAAYFRDAACTVPVLATDAGGPTPAAAQFRDPATGCTVTHAVGDAIEAPPLFLQARGACAPIEAPTTERYHLLADPLALPAVRRVAATGEARRLAPLTVIAAPGPLGWAPDPWLLDRDLATACEIAPVGPGATDAAGDALPALGSAAVCAPVAPAPVVTYFADAACQAPLALAAVPAPACGAPPRFARASADGTTTYHPVGARHPGPIFHVTTGERCEVFGGLPGVALHALGPALTDALAVGVLALDE